MEIEPLFIGIIYRAGPAFVIAMSGVEKSLRDIKGKYCGHRTMKY
jgi:hypothetical protein